MGDPRIGARPSDRALVEPDPAVPALTGFDPSRFKPKSYEGKPRHLSKADRASLDAMIGLLDNYIRELPDADLENVLWACLHVSPINCWFREYDMAESIFLTAHHERRERASGIEARSDETAEQAQPEARARAEGDAQSPSHDR